MIDYEALDKEAQALEDRANGDFKNIVSLQKMESGTSIFIRVLPPTESLKGYFFFEEKGHWIMGERYVSPASFGKAGIIEPIVEEARKSKDQDVLSLLDSRNYNSKSYFYLPILLCDIKFKKGSNEIISVDVVDDEAKILQANSTVIRKLIKIFQSRAAQNGAENRIADREIGMFVEISKSGKKLNTEYACDLIATKFEMDEKYYEEVPDVYAFVKEKMKPASELTEAIENYLEGVTPTKKKKRKDDDEDEDERPSKTRSRRNDDDEDEDERSKKKKRDDDDEEDKPKKSGKNARRFLDNEG